MYRPDSLLCIVAHPDDIEFCCAGTLAQWCSAGTRVSYLICTDGARGSKEAGLSGKAIRDIRRAEQQAAAKILGVNEISCLSYGDCSVEVNEALRKDIVRAIRHVRPEAVFTMDPSFYYDEQLHYINHRDHRAVGEAVLDAVYPMARDATSFPELIDDQHQPHTVKTLLLTNLQKPNFWIDIEPVFDKKLRALFAHTSQIGDQAEARNFFERLARRAADSSPYAMAESFVKIDIGG